MRQCRRGSLGGHLFVRERRNLGALARMFNRDCANVAITIQVHDRVLVQVFGLENRSLAEFNVKRVGICKIFYLHVTNDRSKNALCTVSPSGNKTTRKYLPSASWIGAHRRMRPSCCTISRSGSLMTCSIHSSLIVEQYGRCRMVSKYRVNFTSLL